MVWVIKLDSFSSSGLNWVINERSIFSVWMYLNICSICKKPRTRRIVKEYIPTRPAKTVLQKKSGTDLDPNKLLHKNQITTRRMIVKYHTVGWTDCGCDAEWIRGIVLDPFIGSGTTGVVAKQLSRDFIGIELNPEYVEMANKRISETPSPE